MTELFALEQQPTLAHDNPEDADLITAELLAAAMLVCDRHGDDEAKRQDMRRDCLELSPRLQLDLLQHFTKDKYGTSI